MKPLEELRRLGAALLRKEEEAVSYLPPGVGGRGLDRWLVLATVGLTTFGLAMIYSATSVTSSHPGGHFQNQAMKVMGGIIGFAIGYRVDYHKWGRWAPWGYLLGLLLLALVFVPGLGHSVRHARRWVHVGGFTFQPADFARLTLVVYLAFLLSKPKARLMRFSTGILPCLIALGFMSLLVVVQPNLGTTLALVAIAGLMMLAGQVPLRHLAVLGGVGAGALVLVVRTYQLRRLSSWISYVAHHQGVREANYQIHQSILGIGSGQLLGRGLGESRQKWFFLPDAHTDFIFSIVGEELGLLGAVVLIGLFGVLLWRAYESARRAPDRFGSLLAVGIGAGIAVYAGLNLLVATGWFPTTGLPLPLVSYGGSNVLITLFSLGILANISSQGDTSLPVGIGE